MALPFSNEDRKSSRIAVFAAAVHDLGRAARTEVGKAAVLDVGNESKANVVGHGQPFENRSRKPNKSLWSRRNKSQPLTFPTGRELDRCKVAGLVRTRNYIS